VPSYRDFEDGKWLRNLTLPAKVESSAVRKVLEGKWLDEADFTLTGIDLLAWTQHLLLQGELAAAEPKKLRYRLLHVAARLTRSARRTRLRIAQTWPWAPDLAAAFARLAALPRPSS
jgi:hypothetical protein